MSSPLPVSPLVVNPSVPGLLYSGLLNFGSIAPTRQALGPSADSSAKRNQLALMINRTRVAAGQTPLARNPELEQAADLHSQDMAVNDYLEHEGSDGSSPQMRAAQAGYEVVPGSGWLVVELISAISDEPAGPLVWWLTESPRVHGRHLLDPRYRELGIGYAEGGSYGSYWTALVGCRPGVLPDVELDGIRYRHEERCQPGG
jgi:uncharacterized protein YkwD